MSPVEFAHRLAAALCQQSLGAVVALLVWCSIFACFVLVGALVYVRVGSHRAYRSLLGKVQVPGVTSRTTLVVTDVQASTKLWEALSQAIMDQAMALHDIVMRDALKTWDGYESGNEGDSFIVAFHKPDAALGFCCQVQRELLLQAWPDQLLQEPDACTVWARVSKPTVMQPQGPVPRIGSSPRGNSMGSTGSQDPAAVLDGGRNSNAFGSSSLAVWNQGRVGSRASLNCVAAERASDRGSDGFARTGGFARAGNHPAFQSTTSMPLGWPAERQSSQGMSWWGGQGIMGSGSISLPRGPSNTSFGPVSRSAASLTAQLNPPLNLRVTSQQQQPGPGLDNSVGWALGEGSPGRRSGASRIPALHSGGSFVLTHGYRGPTEAPAATTHMAPPQGLRTLSPDMRHRPYAHSFSTSPGQTGLASMLTRFGSLIGPRQLRRGAGAGPGSGLQSMNGLANLYPTQLAAAASFSLAPQPSGASTGAPVQGSAANTFWRPSVKLSELMNKATGGLVFRMSEAQAQMLENEQHGGMHAEHLSQEGRAQLLSHASALEQRSSQGLYSAFRSASPPPDTLLPGSPLTTASLRTSSFLAHQRLPGRSSMSGQMASPIELMLNTDPSLGLAQGHQALNHQQLQSASHGAGPAQPNRPQRPWRWSGQAGAAQGEQLVQADLEAGSERMSACTSARVSPQAATAAGEAGHAAAAWTAMRVPGSSSPAPRPGSPQLSAPQLEYHHQELAALYASGMLQQQQQVARPGQQASQPLTPTPSFPGGHLGVELATLPPAAHLLSSRDLATGVSPLLLGQSGMEPCGLPGALALARGLGTIQESMPLHTIHSDGTSYGLASTSVDGPSAPPHPGQHPSTGPPKDGESSKLSGQGRREAIAEGQEEVPGAPARPAPQPTPLCGTPHRARAMPGQCQQQVTPRAAASGRAPAWLRGWSWFKAGGILLARPDAQPGRAEQLQGVASQGFAQPIGEGAEPSHTTDSFAAAGPTPSPPACTLPDSIEPTTSSEKPQPAPGPPHTLHHRLAPARALSSPITSTQTAAADSLPGSTPNTTPALGRERVACDPAQELHPGGKQRGSRVGDAPGVLVQGGPRSQGSLQNRRVSFHLSTFGGVAARTDSDSDTDAALLATPSASSDRQTSFTAGDSRLRRKGAAAGLGVGRFKTREPGVGLDQQPSASSGDEGAVGKRGGVATRPAPQLLPPPPLVPQPLDTPKQPAGQHQPPASVLGGTGSCPEGDGLAAAAAAASPASLHPWHPQLATIPGSNPGGHTGGSSALTSLTEIRVSTSEITVQLPMAALGTAAASAPVDGHAAPISPPGHRLQPTAGLGLTSHSAGALLPHPQPLLRPSPQPRPATSSGKQGMAGGAPPCPSPLQSPLQPTSGDDLPHLEASSSRTSSHLFGPSVAAASMRPASYPPNTSVTPASQGGGHAGQRAAQNVDGRVSAVTAISPDLEFSLRGPREGQGRSSAGLTSPAVSAFASTAQKPSLARASLMGLTSPHLTGAAGVTTSALAAGLSLMPLTWREFACRSWPLITDAEYLLMQAGAAGLPEALPSSTDAHPHYSTSTFSLTYVSNPQQQPAKEAVVAMLQYQAAILGGQLVYRGLRVRMGAWAGVQRADDLTFSDVTKRWRFTGEVLRAATAVSNCCAGSQVVITGPMFEMITASPKGLAAAGGVLPAYAGVFMVADLPAPRAPVNGLAARDNSAMVAAAAAMRDMGQQASIAEGGASRSGRASLPRVGDHSGTVGRDEPPKPHVELYQVVPSPGQHCRLAHLPPLRCIGPDGCNVLRYGVPEAPVGVVSFAFIYVIGASTLLAELPKAAREGLSWLQATATAALVPRLGHLMEAADGYCLAAFSSTVDALSWGITVREAAAQHAWPPSLLKHHLCQPVDGLVEVAPNAAAHMVSAVTAAKAASAASKPPHVAASRPMASPWATVSAAMAVNSKPAAAKEHVVIPAGLRLKIGIDVSSVSAELGATTGTINYRGKVLNRAARIAMQATPGKVLCSARAWRRSMEQAALLEAVGTMSPVYVNGRAITAIDRGSHWVKGISVPVQIYELGLEDVAAEQHDDPSAMGRTVSDATPSQGADGHEQMGTSQTWSWEPEGRHRRTRGRAQAATGTDGSSEGCRPRDPPPRATLTGRASRVGSVSDPEACAPDNRSSPTHGESEQLGELLPASHFTRRSHMALMGRDVGGRLSSNRDFVRDSTQSDRSCKGSANCLARVSRAASPPGEPGHTRSGQESARASDPDLTSRTSMWSDRSSRLTSTHQHHALSSRRVSRAESLASGARAYNRSLAVSTGHGSTADTHCSSLSGAGLMLLNPSHNGRTSYPSPALSTLRTPNASHRPAHAASSTLASAAAALAAAAGGLDVGEAEPSCIPAHLRLAFASGGYCLEPSRGRGKVGSRGGDTQRQAMASQQYPLSLPQLPGESDFHIMSTHGGSEFSDGLSDGEYDEDTLPEALKHGRLGASFTDGGVDLLQQGASRRGFDDRLGQRVGRSTQSFSGALALASSPGPSAGSFRKSPSTILRSYQLQDAMKPPRTSASKRLSPPLAFTSAATHELSARLRKILQQGSLERDTCVSNGLVRDSAPVGSEHASPSPTTSPSAHHSGHTGHTSTDGRESKAGGSLSLRRALAWTWGTRGRGRSSHSGGKPGSGGSAQAAEAQHWASPVQGPGTNLHSSGLPSYDGSLCRSSAAPQAAAGSVHGSGGGGGTPGDIFTPLRKMLRNAGIRDSREEPQQGSPHSFSLSSHNQAEGSTTLSLSPQPASAMATVLQYQLCSGPSTQRSSSAISLTAGAASGPSLPPPKQFRLSGSGALVAVAPGLASQSAQASPAMMQTSTPIGLPPSQRQAPPLPKSSHSGRSLRGSDEAEVALTFTAAQARALSRPIGPLGLVAASSASARKLHARTLSMRLLTTQHPRHHEAGQCSRDEQRKPGVCATVPGQSWSPGPHSPPQPKDMYARSSTPVDNSFSSLVLPTKPHSTQRTQNSMQQAPGRSVRVAATLTNPHNDGETRSSSMPARDPLRQPTSPSTPAGHSHSCSHTSASSLTVPHSSAPLPSHDSARSRGTPTADQPLTPATSLSPALSLHDSPLPSPALQAANMATRQWPLTDQGQLQAGSRPLSSGTPGPHPASHPAGTRQLPSPTAPPPLPIHAIQLASRAEVVVQHQGQWFNSPVSSGGLTPEALAGAAAFRARGGLISPDRGQEQQQEQQQGQGQQLGQGEGASQQGETSALQPPSPSSGAREQPMADPEVGRPASTSTSCLPCHTSASHSTSHSSHSPSLTAPYSSQGCPRQSAGGSSSSSSSMTPGQGSSPSGHAAGAQGAASSPTALPSRFSPFRTALSSSLAAPTPTGQGVQGGGMDLAPALAQEAGPPSRVVPLLGPPPRKVASRQRDILHGRRPSLQAPAALLDSGEAEARPDDDDGVLAPRGGMGAPPHALLCGKAGIAAAALLPSPATALQPSSPLALADVVLPQPPAAVHGAGFSQHHAHGLSADPAAVTAFVTDWLAAGHPDLLPCTSHSPTGNGAKEEQLHQAVGNAMPHATGLMSLMLTNPLALSRSSQHSSSKGGEGEEEGEEQHPTRVTVAGDNTLGTPGRSTQAWRQLHTP